MLGRQNILRILAVLTVCLFWHETNSQEKNAFDYWLEAYNNGIEYYNAGDFTNATPHLESALEYIDLIDFSTNQETELYPIENRYNLGVCYLNQNKPEKAADLLETALIETKSLSFNDDDYITGIMSDLAQAYSNFNLQKALEYRLKVVERLKLRKGKDILLAINLYNLAFNYYHFNKDEDFYKYLLETETILTEINETTSDYYAFTSYYLGYYYYNKNNFKKAIYFFDKAEKLAHHFKGIDGMDLRKVIYNRGLSHFVLENYSMAAIDFQKVLDFKPEIEDGDIDFLIVVADELATCYLKLDKLKKAENVYLKLIDETSTKIENSSLAYAKIAFRLGQFYTTTEQYENSIKLLTKAKTIFVNKNETENREYFYILNALGIYHFNKGNYQESESNYIEALNRNNNNIDDIDMANVKGNLAQLYQTLGQYDKSKKLYEESLASKKNILGENSSVYIKSLIPFGNLLSEMGDYNNALKIYLKAKTVLTNTIGTSSLLYADLQLNFGNIYIKLLEPQEALNAYNLCKNIYEEKQLTNISAYAYALSGIGNISYLLGDGETGINYIGKAYNILEKTVGNSQLEFAKIAIALGESYYSVADYSNAINYYLEAINILKKSVPDNYYLYGNIFGQIGLIYAQSNDYENSHKFLDLAIANYKENFGEENLGYLSLLRLKGAILLRAKKFIEAKPIVEKSVDLIAKTSGKDIELYQDALFLLAHNYHSLGEYQLAQKSFKDYHHGLLNIIENNFSYRSESEKKKFLNRLNIWVSWLNNLVLDTNYDNEFVELGLNNQLIYKSLLLNSTKDIFEKLSSSKDSITQQQIANYKILKTKINKSLVTAVSESTSSFDKLHEKAKNLELELQKKYISLYGSEDNHFNRNWKDISTHLKSSELSIEFAHYYAIENGNLTKNIKYIAYLSSSKWDYPKVVDLFNESDLKAILKHQNPNSLYQTRGSKAKSTTNTKVLYDLIWLPLEDYLDGVETIYYSPSGLLNQIPFAALDTEGQPILASQYNLVQFSNTYNLKDLKREVENENALFIGGIDYDDLDSNNIKTNQNNFKLSSLKSVSGTRSLGSSWNYLPGTLNEVNSLKELFSEHDKSFSILTNKKATESVFKALSGNSPKIIHIATHGFFFENPKDSDNDMLKSQESNVYNISENPLLRSGLLFAGANNTWKNSENNDSENDGVLTALEISSLDLSNTDIVVLSACETGLGDIDGSEGVYGLQRAFKMAGVDLIIMSLWEVPDAETSEFMTSFYTNWLSGQNIRTAFRNTQLEMSTIYKDNPEKWAAFVLIE